MCIFIGGEIVANIKQQIKRNKTNEKRRLTNASFKSSVKSAIKAVELSVESNDKEKALENLSFAHKKLDKGLAKGIYHKNFVARNKSQLSKLVNSL
jgi:small subunit ribosomal protein S20